MLKKSDLQLDLQFPLTTYHSSSFIFWITSNWEVNVIAWHSTQTLKQSSFYLHHIIKSNNSKKKHQLQMTNVPIKVINTSHDWPWRLLDVLPTCLSSCRSQLSSLLLLLLLEKRAVNEANLRGNQGYEVLAQCCPTRGPRTACGPPTDVMRSASAG